MSVTEVGTLTRVCMDCGNDFEISPGEMEFYNSKQLNLPKRCSNCRDKRKPCCLEMKKAQRTGLIRRQGKDMVMVIFASPMNTESPIVRDVVESLVMKVCPFCRSEFDA